MSNQNSSVYIFFSSLLSGKNNSGKWRVNILEVRICWQGPDNPSLIIDNQADQWIRSVSPSFKTNMTGENVPIIISSFEILK